MEPALKTSRSGILFLLRDVFLVQVCLFQHLPKEIYQHRENINVYEEGRNKGIQIVRQPNYSRRRSVAINPQASDCKCNPC